MEFSKEAKIELAVSKDPLRPALCNVRFTGKYLVASDGHIAAWIPAKADEQDTPGPIQPEVFKEARKASKTMADCILFANGNVRTLSGTQYKRPEDKGYPNVARIIPRHNKGQKVVINVDLLKRLSDALGTEYLELVLPEGENVERGILVNPVVNNQYGEGRGVIMPCRKVRE